MTKTKFLILIVLIETQIIFVTMKFILQMFVISVMSECKCFGEKGNINSIKKKLLESDEAPRALVFLESRK